MGDDSIDTVILHIDMGYLVTLVPTTGSKALTWWKKNWLASGMAFCPTARAMV